MRMSFRGLAVALAAVFTLAAIPTASAESPVLNQQEGYEQLAANFLAQHLRRHDGLAVDPEGKPALANTAYAIAALVASGYNVDQAKTSALILRTSGESFIGSSAEIEDKTTALALTILSQRLTDFDPTTFPISSGTRDLVADLTSAINEDGSIGAWASAYGQGYALMALAAGGDPIPDTATSWLVAQPCAESGDPGFGGFGFSTGSCEDVDPDSTALAILGLLHAKSSVDSTATVANAIKYLGSIQDSSGGFMSSLAGVNANSSGLVVSALNAASAASVSSPAGSPNIDKARKYLLSLTYRCKAGLELVGGIAYDTQAFTALPSPLDVPTESALVASTAQGMLGLWNSVVGRRGEVHDRVESEEVCRLVGESGLGTVPCDERDGAPYCAQETNGGFPLWGWAIVAVVVLGAVAGVFIVRSKKSKKDPVDATPEDPTPAEPSAEDIPEEDILEEETLEEDILEEDTPEEDTTSAEPSAEDTIAEDPTTEESSPEESTPDNSTPPES